jgi:predicted SAM-dependent methyltransferase
MLKKLKLRKLLKSHNPAKLHLGCGTVYKDGWINIDDNLDRNCKKLDMKWNLARGIPASSNSVDYIFHEHLLEHLTYEQGKNFISECLRVLKPGGVLRFSTPDLALVVAEYSDPELFAAGKPFRERFGYDSPSPCMILNRNLRLWGHLHVYDAAEIFRLLSEIRVSADKITNCGNSQSKHSDLRGLETRGTEGFCIFEVEK